MARHEPHDGAPAPADGEAVPGWEAVPREEDALARRLARARAALASALAEQGIAEQGMSARDGTASAAGGFGEAAQAGYAVPSAAVPAAPRRRRPRPAPLGAEGLDAVLGGGLARGTIHEILAREAGDLGAAHGFALALAARLAAPAAPRSLESRGAENRGAESRGAERLPGRVLLVQDEEAAREDGAPYGPGLALHGLDPARLVLVRARDAHEALWATEQALRCRALGAVLAEIARLPGLYDLTASRRLVLAAREGGTTGLVVQAAFGAGAGTGARASAAESRFVVAAAPSRPGLAGTPGAPAWRVHLARHRGGREGLYHLEWSHDDRAFRELEPRAHEPAAGEALPRPRPADARDGPRAAAGATARRLLLPFPRRA
ncbi:ImuA family protein [Salinarimonas ramus]|uniref:Protein ImuA n=1 Tax=Salinarimonas ramus TaxID=690164 RepID=A0A917VA59_9HYPH|nr:hypothetical protein [Salinarimonas ramus]GGK53637.1 hypothetical protein GCM10011322_45550 [Salinarimonas ramus]